MGRGPRLTDRLLGGSFSRTANSYSWYLCNWDSKSGLILQPWSGARKEREKKKKIVLQKKKKMLSRKLLCRYHCAQPMRHKEKSPHSRAVPRGVGSTNVIETAGIQR